MRADFSFKSLLMFFVLCGLLCGPVSVSAKDSGVDAPGLSEATAELMDENGAAVLQGILEKSEIGEDMESDVKNVREDALKQTAYTLGLQKAVKWRYGKIRALLADQASRLDRVFDFRPLLMHDGRVLPPAITEATKGYRVESDVQASSVDVVYQIIRPARMVSNPPSWRDYLWRTYPSFTEEDIQAGVLPENDEERRLWKKAAVKGWEVGIQQAERLYRNNLSRLKRDYQGIVKFRLLAEQEIVSLPVVAEGRPGIEVQGKKLSIDRRIFRITKKSTFQEERKWKPKIGTE